MRPEVQAPLFDIAEACRRIQRFAAGMDYTEYEQDELLRSAVERQFVVVGEALERLHRAAPETAESLTHWQRIIAFPNRLTRAHDASPHAVVWGVVVRNVPLLLAEVEALLEAEPDTG
jgi:uncharacterized protein with HEPN domain